MSPIITFSLVFICAAASVYSAEKPKQEVAPLRVIIKSLRASVGHTELQIRVHNDQKRELTLSEFSLACAMRSAKFTATNGSVWIVSSPSLVEDPPSPDVDFRLPIKPNSAREVSVVTPPLKRADPHQLGAAERPKGLQLHYELSTEVSTRAQGIGIRFIKALGSGKVQVQWEPVE